MRKAVHPAFLSVTYPQRMNAGQIARMAGIKEPALDGGVKRARLDQPAAAAGQPDHGIILDQGGSLVRR
jgi:hypothetical protein